jgi:hypothetical protein
MKQRAKGLKNMNILIAGIISVIILLFGGAGYYNNYILPKKNRRVLELAQQHANESSDYFDNLPQIDFNGKVLRVIRTEEELIYIAQHFPGNMRLFAISLSPTLTNDRALYLLQETIPKTAADPDLIPNLQRQFIPEGDHV